MKVFMVLLAFCVVFCYHVKASKEWSLLRQSEYDVKMEIARMDSFNSSYFKYVKLDAVPYNRTFRVLNGSFEFVQDLNKRLLAEVQFYKFLSNEYRFFPLTFECDACTEYNHDTFGLKEFFDGFSNYNPCFMKKDVQYRIMNGALNFSKWPPHIPFGRYQMQLNILDKINRSNMECFSFYVEIKEKHKH